MTLLFNAKTHKGNDLEIYTDSGRVPMSPAQVMWNRVQMNSLIGVENERAQASEAYNCHGLTLIGRMGWFNNDKIITLLTDNGFRLKVSIPDISREKVMSIHNILPGDVVLYKQPDNSGNMTISHTCTVYQVKKLTTHGNCYHKLKVLSKLGQSGEYFHDINNAFVKKIYGSTIEIWSNSI